MQTEREVKPGAGRGRRETKRKPGVAESPRGRVTADEES